MTQIQFSLLAFCQILKMDKVMFFNTEGVLQQSGFGLHNKLLLTCNKRREGTLSFGLSKEGVGRLITISLSQLWSVRVVLLIPIWFKADTCCLRYTACIPRIMSARQALEIGSVNSVLLHRSHPWYIRITHELSFRLITLSEVTVQKKKH